MLRSLVVVVAACSSSSPAQPTPSLAQLVPGDARSVLAWRPSEFPLLSFLDAAPDMFACWRELELRITASYQVFTAPGHSIAVLEGDLPREQVEACAELALNYARLTTTDVRRDGELSVLDTRLGTVYAAWRGRSIVFGNRDGVTAALAAQPSAAWRDALAELPPTDMSTSTMLAGVSFDPMFTNLLGVPTTRWKLTMSHPSPVPWPARELMREDQDSGDALERYGKEQAELARRRAAGLPPVDAGVPPPKPAPVFSGRIELRYANAADAAKAAHALAQAAFSIPLEENLAAAVAHLPQSIVDTTLVVTFDQSRFADVSLEKLQAWAAKLQAR